MKFFVYQGNGLSRIYRTKFAEWSTKDEDAHDFGSYDVAELVAATCGGEVGLE